MFWPKRWPKWHYGFVFGYRCSPRDYNSSSTICQSWPPWEEVVCVESSSFSDLGSFLFSESVFSMHQLLWKFGWSDIYSCLSLLQKFNWLLNSSTCNNNRKNQKCSSLGKWKVFSKTELTLSHIFFPQFPRLEAWDSL